MPEQDKLLVYLDLLKFGVWNIHRISSVDEITGEFGSRIEDITVARQAEMDPLIAQMSSMYMGQQHLVYSYRETARLHGEFSIDMLPCDGREYIRNEMHRLAGRQNQAGGKPVAMRLANFRVQLFSRGLFARRRISRKYEESLSWLESTLGPKDKDLARQFKLVNGLDMDYWVKECEENRYIVTLYVLPRKPGVLPSVSFSISEVWSEPPRII